PVAAQSLLEQVPLEFSPNEIIWDTRFRAALYLPDYDAATRASAATPVKFAVLIFGGGQPPESWADGLIARARGGSISRGRSWCSQPRARMGMRHGAPSGRMRATLLT